MDRSSIIFTILFVSLPNACMGKTLGTAMGSGQKTQFGGKDASLAFHHDQAGLQSWNDWSVKRGFGELPKFGDNNLQSWKQWMEKRSAFHPGSAPRFGSEFASPDFQQWKDWMDKRGFPVDSHGMFKGSVPGSETQFQMWSDWMKKRGLGDIGNGDNMFGQARGGKFQSWADFSKKANFGGDPDFLGVGRMQPWQMFQKKRFGDVNHGKPFSVPFDTHTNFMKWDGTYKRSADKRQLGTAPAGFGHYRQYFTNGLQDWRKMFQNSKRNQAESKSEQGAN